jgi:hypothetical protein
MTVEFTYDGYPTVPVATGSYAVTGTVNNANYEGSTNGTLVISKANASVTLGDLTQTYNGAAKTASAVTVPEGMTVDFTYNGIAEPPSAAGSYAVTGTVNNANYACSTNGTLVISKAVAALTLANMEQTYDGTAKSVSAITVPEGMTVEFTYDGLPTVPVAAGSYAVTGTVKNANYECSTSGTLIISTATATLTLGDLAQTYDGTAKAASATTAPAGIAFELTYNGLVEAPSAAGSYAVTCTVYDVNYAGSTNGTLVISKASASVTLGDLFAIYDGAAKAASATTVPEGMTVYFTYDGLPTVPVAAGSYAVIGTVNNANYAGSTNGVLVISKATASVTLGDLTHIYDGTAKAASALTVPKGMTVDFTYNGLATVPTIAGIYAVTGTVNNSNYEGSTNGTLVISKAIAPITIGNLAQTYDGTPKAASVVTEPEGLTVAFTYNGLAEVPLAAGNYAVTGTVNDVNYAGATNGILVISKAVASVSLGSLCAIYDGTAKPASAVTVPEGLTLDFTYNGLATVPTIAGIYAVTGTVNNANYTGSTNGFLVISKATAKLILGNLSAVYDGTAKTVSVVTTPEGLAVVLTCDGLVWAPTNAGIYAVTGTVSSVNYAGSTNGTLVISKANQSITFPAIPAQLTTNVVGLAATSRSGLGVSFSLGSGAATLTGTNLSFNATGSVSIVASQGGNANWNAAPTVTNTFMVTKAMAGVSLHNLSQTYTGSPHAATATTVPDGLSVAVTYNGSSTAPTAAGSYAVTGTVNHVMYQGSGAGTLVIAKGAQVVTMDAIADQMLGDSAFTPVVFCSSGLSAVLSIVSGPATADDGLITSTGLGEVIVQADQPGDANWAAAAPVQRSFRVVAGDFAQGYVWAKGFGSSGYDTAYAIAADAEGHAYLFGDFENTVTFGASAFTVSGGSLSDLVLMKLNNNGSVAWARQYGGVNSDLAKTVVALPSGGVVAGGEFYTSTTISGTNLTSSGSKDIALFKVDADGTTQWVKRFGGTSSDSLNSMAADTNGNIYLAGQFSGSIIFGATTLASSGSSDGFVAKLNASGAVLWACKMGGIGVDSAYTVAVRADGKIAVAGSFNGGATFGSILLSSAGSTDAFATLLDSNGVFLWAKRFGGTTADSARSVAFDTAGDLWVSGSFTGSSATGFGATPLVSAGAEDVFVVRLAATDGTVSEASRFGGTGSETALSLAADPFGTMILSGSFQNTVAFGTTSLVSSGISDTYIAKLRAGAGVVWALRGGGVNNDNSQALAVNPSGEIFQAGVFDTAAAFGTHSVTGGGSWDMFVAKINGSVPAFTSVLADLTVVEGDPWSLSTGTLGATPVTFQWFKDGAPISGATSNSFGSASALAADAGVYALAAVNGYGSATTTPVVVTVIVPDQILSVTAPASTAENRTIDAPVYLESLGDVTGLSFIVPYDKAYLSNPVFTLGPYLVAGNSSVVIDKNAGTVRVVGSAFPSSIPEGRMLVGTLRFTVRSVPAGASVTLTPTLLSISDLFGRPIEGYTKLSGCTMAIAQRDIPGDANNNGRLDVSDAAELIRLYANPSQIRTWDQFLNDLNGDTILTEGDATRVLRVVANLDDTPSFPESAPMAGPRLVTAALTSFAVAPSETRSVALPSKTFSKSGGIIALGESLPPSARIVLTRLTGANTNKVMAQVYLDDVPAGQAGLSFRVDYPAALLRIAGSSSLIVPSGGLPSGTTQQWNVAPGNDYANQSGHVYCVCAWGSSWTFSAGQAVINIIFELRSANSGQVHFPVTLTTAEVAPYSAEGPSSPLTVTGQVVTFTRTYADWALATLGNANAAPSADTDRDGFSNAFEFAASTNPNDIQSRLQVTSAYGTLSGFTVRWFAAYGVNYRVVVSSDLIKWDPLAGSSVTGTGVETEITELSPVGTSRFYRVEIVP